MSPEDYERRAERIRAGLQVKNLSLRALAKQIGVSSQYLNSILANRPGRKHLPAIAEALGCSVEWLQAGEGSAPHEGGSRILGVGAEELCNARMAFNDLAQAWNILAMAYMQAAGLDVRSDAALALLSVPGDPGSAPFGNRSMALALALAELHRGEAASERAARAAAENALEKRPATTPPGQSIA